MWRSGWTGEGKERERLSGKIRPRLFVVVVVVVRVREEKDFV